MPKILWINGSKLWINGSKIFDPYFQLFLLFCPPVNVVIVLITRVMVAARRAGGMKVESVLRFCTVVSIFRQTHKILC